MKELPKKYNAKDTEARWQGYWEEHGTYRWESDLPREQTFVIDTPPPTVSGLLHMGHIFSYTQADFLARYQRMAGKTVFYPMGFDDNGLPTERLVEKTIKKRAVDLGREAFITECERVTKQARADFRALFHSVALSIDWNEEYHTISEHSRRMSQRSFLDLLAKNEAERRLQPMLWDPVDQTAIAQAEVEDKEMESTFNDIYFAIEDSDERIVIGTTRPELIPACVAVFYHPEDERYKHLKGKHAVTPLFGVKVPILEDDTVEPDKGTGIMMSCTFGDEADVEKWKKHDLPLRIIINKFGKMDFSPLPESEENAAYAALKGLRASHQDKGFNKDPSKSARAKVLEMLDEAELLVEKKPITHAVKCAERSGAPLEIIPTPQWFVKVMDKKQAFHARGEEITWYPKQMKIRLDQWIDGLSWDWCISRQRYYGVPFPVWYSKRAGEEGKVLTAHPDDLPVNPLTDLPRGYNADEVDADPDVMDTWATSAVSPQINSGLLCSPLEGEQANQASSDAQMSRGGASDNADTPPLDSALASSAPPQGGSPTAADRHAKLFPADLRPQAHEIIRTWLFYTLAKAHMHNASIPWKNVMISGWCLAEDKTKMSKSKGNVVVPTTLIEQNGADAVRYWASTSKLGTDTAYSPDVIKIGKKLVTKLWNATKFAAQHLEHISDAPGTAAEDVASGRISEALDLWILSRLHNCINKATKEFEQYEYSDARSAIEDFFWNDFCDNYLELCKTRSYGEDGTQKSAQMSAIYTLHHCLDAILKLFAPFVPHITEELYSHIFDGEFAHTHSVHARGTWPDATDYPANAEAERNGKAIVSILGAIRKLKAERGVSIKYPLTEVAIHSLADAPDENALTPALADLKHSGNAHHITFSDTTLDASVTTEDGKYRISGTFAAEAEVA